MSWHYLQGQEAASWEGTCLAGAPSALSSLIPTPAASCWPDNAMDGFHDSRYGTTCGHSIADHGEASLTSCPEASRAKTFPAPEKGPESRASEAACGSTWLELSARYDRVSCGWRTHRCLFAEALPWSSVTLPRWGMMRNGALWERTTPGLLTSGTGFGFWPTPRAGKVGSEDAETWMKRNKEGKVATPPLGLAVKMWPTPKSRDWKGQSQRGIHGPMDALPNIDKGDGTPIGGSLNPMWVEWLMGWPLGWTDCAASATDKSRRPWPWRGIF
ncbi:MAG: hypothetical protein RL153_1416 [Verrucomicrobiota bacterium]